MKLSDYKKVHCIGIGGIGISGLARYFVAKGALVSGSDQASSKITEDLNKEGVSISIGHNGENIPVGVSLVIYTIAVGEDNVEFVEAKKRRVAMLTYPEALGQLTKEYTTISICGTHGKTTTTAMVAKMLEVCGESPTVIVGSLLSETGTNFILGTGKYLVIESCEYKRSFLELHPKHILITNIDEDHLDYYKDINDITSAFQSFVEGLDDSGIVVAHSDVHLTTNAKWVNGDLVSKEKIVLSVPGDHNKENARLAYALGLELGLPEEKIREGLLSFKGTWRRLEYKGKTTHGAPVYDDYGHHPKELKATFQALREKYPKESHSLYVFFQPHLHSRTKLLFDDFVQVLKEVDKLFLLPIYRARFEDTTVVTEKELIDEVNLEGGNVVEVFSLSEISGLVEGIEDSSAVILNIGAGDAYKELDKIQFS